MTKQQRPSLEALATSQRDSVTTVQRSNVTTLPSAAAARPSPSHTSLYVSKPVLREIKKLALDYDRKPHDLYIEALDLLLRKYGRPSVAELSTS
jgi:hypothetical protein